jgi:hypothetical protein
VRFYRALRGRSRWLFRGVHRGHDIYAWFVLRFHESSVSTTGSRLALQHFDLDPSPERGFCHVTGRYLARLPLRPSAGCSPLPVCGVTGNHPTDIGPTKTRFRSDCVSVWTSEGAFPTRVRGGNESVRYKQNRKNQAPDYLPEEVSLRWAASIAPVDHSCSV